MTDVSAQLAAVQSRYDVALAGVTQTAAATRAAVDAQLQTLSQMLTDDRPPLIPGIPVDEPPAYVPPHVTAAANALIPDTPLVDASPVFDDAPLWQS
jgi:hypothetical protein